MPDAGPLLASLAAEDIVIPQGATVGAGWPISWQYLIGSTPVDLTAWRARMEIRNRAGGDTLYLRLHSPDDPTADGTITLDSAGYVAPFLPAAVTIGQTWRTGWYDLELIPPAPSTEIVRLVSGKVSLSREVTIGA